MFEIIGLPNPDVVRRCCRICVRRSPQNHVAKAGTIYRAPTARGRTQMGKLHKKIHTDLKHTRPQINDIIFEANIISYKEISKCLRNKEASHCSMIR